MSSRHGSPAPGKAGRLARSRAACEACHRVKQRCDGPSICPCHRCKTWGIECIFPSSAGPVPSQPPPAQAKASKHTATGTGKIKGKGKAVATPTSVAHPRRSSTASDAAAAAPPPPPLGGTAASAASAAPSAMASITPIELTQQLRAMAARLESIEGALARAEVSFPASSSSHSHHLSNHRPSHSHSGQTVSDETPLSGPYAHEQHQHQPNTSNPVEATGEAIEAMAVEGLVGLSDSHQQSRSRATSNGIDNASAANPEVWDPSRPDVLSRTLMTVEDCESAFDVQVNSTMARCIRRYTNVPRGFVVCRYFDNLQPWVLSLSSTLDRNPLTVRTRSPLLFHSILLISIYYRERTTENLALYEAISAIIDSILAPNILCPQPDQLSSDFIRSIHLLTLYKPLPIATFRARGIKDLAAIEHASKMNVRASWLLRLIASRVAMFIGLPSITTTFARAFANQHEAPIPQSIISEQRLYFGCVFHEAHGALQSGKPSNFVPQDALKSTRLFASLKNQPEDVRLAASVELAATAASVLATRKEGDYFDREDLHRFEDEMSQWTEYWQPILAANEQRDRLAWTAAIPYQAFIRVVVHGYSFARWKVHKTELQASLQPAPLLTEHEHESLDAAVEASAAILLAVSVEGKRIVPGKGIETSWENVKGILTVDPNVADKVRWASDSLTCVLFSYPLIFLAKLANEGLLLSSFSVLAASTQPIPLAPLSPSDKLCLLLQLGANFLHTIAPHSSHPAIKQAAFLRKIHEAGISGRKQTLSVPTSPKLSATSSIPVPMTTNLSLSEHSSLTQTPSNLLPLSNGSYHDFLSTTWNPSPIGSPRNVDHVMEDPFGALLSGVEPGMMFASGQRDLFGFETGFTSADWDGLDAGAAAGAQNGGGANGRMFKGGF
ncbi:BZ3500_MvSof-1268-A1-R1_Chr6-3g08880 [Microbotryum saponariae]|uniref:BZ3500_MvSof-1268-A1-R1_Chr6-3g08880 protein n=1 Tax=Microbotryum saponariae TaxID=289078 RepID=A0A2X0MHJ8_9BASI|nr:BZ3500_MvSof-1268-A1-R1_Chr6-3g08880 [Microbotryum saponariae]SDA07481.1 BZ3501_MvSof-1269-A2-R1_Chr6-2g08583 [Microbotryum saponariae]